jgi:hypothetical protein
MLFTPAVRDEWAERRGQRLRLDARLGRSLQFVTRRCAAQRYTLACLRARLEPLAVNPLVSVRAFVDAAVEGKLSTERPFGSTQVLTTKPIELYGLQNTGSREVRERRMCGCPRC